MGTYLQRRFATIADALVESKLATLVSSSIDEVDFREHQFILRDSEGEKHWFDEVLLTIGHQPTERSEQLEKWKDYTERNSDVFLYEKPYPAEAISNAAHLSQHSVVGIRGFGLAMIDVARALTIGRGGEFKVTDEETLQSVFVAGQDVPQKIVAFSLNGNPMAPKPFNARVDEWFTPTDDEIEAFGKKIEYAASGQQAIDSTMFLKEAMATVAARVYSDLSHSNNPHGATSEEIYPIIIDWLSDESTDHPLLQPIDNPTKVNMLAFTQMALGNAPVSLDYCTGQVWRHCQPTLYKTFAHANLSSEVIASVISLDERVKRYSYGPPLESMQQLLALLEADLLTLDFVADPDIKLTEAGWELSAQGKKITVDTMINSVLDPPRLTEVISPVVCSLLDNALIEPIHSALGIHTDRNACIEVSEGKGDIPLAVLGRLSKGSVLGVDAILECFSQNERAWAAGVVQRLNDAEQE